MAITGKRYSSAIFSAKKANVTICPDSGIDVPKETEIPKRVNIEEAENGFIINKSGGSYGYRDKPVVTENIDVVTDVVKSYLGKKKKEKEKEKES